MTSSARTAVLILRAWRDPTEKLVRCRIVLTDDVLTGAQRAVAASGTDQACEIVHDWLENITSGDASVTAP